MAGGNNERWGLAIPKEVAKIKGVPLLKRTLHQLETLGWHNDKIVVVTHKPQCQDIARYFRVWAYNQPTRWLCDAVMSAREWWGDRTTILLGDVVYTLDALRAILEHMSWYGYEKEIFGVTWVDNQKMAKCLTVASKDAKHTSHKYRGKLWAVYQDWNGRPLDETGVGLHRIGKEWTFIRDETEDIDTVSDYQRLKARGLA
jgi:choline kinase